MQAKLKITESAPIWSSRENEIWDAEIVVGAKIDYPYGNVHIIRANNQEYSFDLKNARIGRKVSLLGFLADKHSAGKVVFEIQ